MPIDIIMPRVGGYDVNSATLMRWLKQTGDRVVEGEPVAEVESAKANLVLPAPAAGTLVSLLVPAPSEVPVGTVLAVLATSDEQAASVGPGARAGLETAGTEDDRLRVSPVARRLAAEWGISLEGLPGSGPGGRITREDIERFHNEASGARATETRVPSASEGHPTGDLVALSKLRRAIAERMTTSATTVPQFAVECDIEVGAALELRRKLNQTVEAPEISVTDFIVRAAVRALARFPDLNASFQNGKLLMHREINLGLAVAVDGGLITVVIPGAQDKSLGQLARYSRALVARVRAGQLQPDDLAGGTFTISNLGMHGITRFTPILNPPEAALLGIGMARDIAVPVNGQITVQKQMAAILVVDHRVADGVQAAAFLGEIKGLLEDPHRLLL